MKILPAIVGALCSLVVVGCSEDTGNALAGCAPHCEGDMRVTCGTADAGDQVEIRRNCAETGLHCAVAGGVAGIELTAVCALQATRLSDCEGKASICQSNYVTTCFDGFPMARQFCEETNRVCFGGASEAGCVVSATAEPACAGAGSAWVCVGDKVVQCFEGRAATRHDCVGCTLSGTSTVDSNGQPCN